MGYIDWDSYEAPPVVFGGLGIFIEETAVKRPNGDCLRVEAWNLTGNLPYHEKVESGTEILRPKGGLIFRLYHNNGELLVSDVCNGKTNDRHTLNFDEVVGNAQTLFKHARIEFNGEHISAMSGKEDKFKPYITGSMDYSFAIPRHAKDAEIKISHDWHTIPGGYFSRVMNPDMTWCIFIHATEEGRSGGLTHANQRVTENFWYENGRMIGGVYHGNIFIRDLEALGERYAEAIFTPSRIMKEELLFIADTHGVCYTVPRKLLENKLFAIYHGVDDSGFHPMNIEKPEMDRILFIGRFAQVKGVDNLIRACQKLFPKYPIELKLIGGGSYEEGTSIKNYIKENNLTDRIIVDTKWYPKKEKAEELNKATVAVFPSTYEPSGQTHFEAMACGIPTLIGFGGWREHTVDGRTTLWVDSTNPDDIANKIERIITDSKFAEGLGQEGLELVKKFFPWDKRATVYKYVHDAIRKQAWNQLRELEDTVLAPTDLIKKEFN